jgi:hypothetical protein
MNELVKQQMNPILPFLTSDSKNYKWQDIFAQLLKVLKNLNILDCEVSKINLHIIVLIIVLLTSISNGKYTEKLF